MLNSTFITSYERDIETDLDFAQARMHNYNLGRFTSPDDFLNDTNTSDTQSWNLYVYVRNNPLNFTDSNGERVYVGKITNKEDRDKLLNRLNYTYGCEGCVTIEDDYVEVDTSSLSKELKEATQFLTDAIQKGTINFDVQIVSDSTKIAFGGVRGRTSIPGKSERTGKDIKITAYALKLDFSDDERVEGNSKAKDSFLNLIFAHEVRHFSPKNTDDPSSGDETGAVADSINEIRQLIGLPLRAEYLSKRRNENDPNIFQVSFGQAATYKKSGKIERNKKNGSIRVVKEADKAVYWNKQNVGGRGIN